MRSVPSSFESFAFAAVMSYKPGQGGIDGGGWEIVKQEPDYIYVQYQSEKIGDASPRMHG